MVLFVIVSPLASNGEILKEDTVWSGNITVDEDILVPEGVTLSIKAGTVVKIRPSDRTSTDPEYLSSLLEITVRGRLEIEGTSDEPVLIHMKGDNVQEGWSGIIIDGGSARIRHCTVENAETGIFVLQGMLNIKDSFIRENRYGLVTQGAKTKVWVKNTKITENDYGVYDLNNSKATYSNTHIKENSKKDMYWYGTKRRSSKGMIGRRQMSTHKRSSRACRKSTSDLIVDYEDGKTDTTIKYRDDVLSVDTVWRGRVEIDGLVRVPEHVRLIILPGTVVEFKKRDSDGDGIGENGLLMLGVLIAKGTNEHPIIFRSSEEQRKMGDWDAINIINSNGTQNLVEFCQIEDAYRGLNFQFSNVMVNNSVLKNNYRAIQFQESLVELRENYIFNNKSGINASDSRIVFKDNYVFKNINGLNFFRTTLTAQNNHILNNLNEGLGISGGTTFVRENLIDCNRFGLRINDSFFGRFERNVVSNNFQTGISLKGGDNIDLSGNFIQGNGFDGINILASGAIIRNNHISENGVRGIGIQSFSGTISENIIVNNRRYAIENESSADILTPMNWWGARRADKVIYDKFDDPKRGLVIFSPALLEPLAYEWPLDTVSRNTTWYGAVSIMNRLHVTGGSVLTVKPGMKVLFAEGAGLKIKDGKIISAGKEEKRILFTSLNKKPERSWDEILLENGSRSLFSYCDFEHATWALHSHFADLEILNSVFRENEGGMRFSNGHLKISESLFTKNRIGLRTNMATARIKDSEFISNETGIFVQRKGGGLTITNNNFYSNTDYNIRVGDFNREDINAIGNWWGTDTPVETFFEGRRESGEGIVDFEPFLVEKLNFEDEEETDEESAGDKGRDVRESD